MSKESIPSAILNENITPATWNNKKTNNFSFLFHSKKMKKIDCKQKIGWVRNSNPLKFKKNN